jgi:uncharacterized coiled-coil protein SlyX
MNSEQLKAYIGVAHYVQQPADWKADEDSVQYIKNKPDIAKIESGIKDNANNLDAFAQLATSKISVNEESIRELKAFETTTTNRLSVIANEVGGHKTSIDTLYTRVGEVNQTLNTNLPRITALETTSAGHTTRIENLEKVNSNSRLDTLEKENLTIKQNITSNTTRISNLETKSSRIDDMLTGLGDQIVSVGGDVTELNNKVDSLHTKQGSDIAVVQDLQIGQMFYHTTYKILAIYNGYEWIDLNGRQLGKHSGTFGDAPTYLNNTTDVGYQFFDTDKDMNMWWNGTEWVDANGDNL